MSRDTTRTTRRRTTRAAATLVAVGMLAGCGFGGAEDLPLPGGAGGGGYAVTLTFENAANLVPQETCRANDTVVGSVESVELDEELRAVVVCRIERDVDIPRNVEGALRQTSLLGERYVSLEVPADIRPSRASLADGAVVPASATRTEPDTELVLGSLSQVLNGGSLGRVATISDEISTALEGRAGQAREGTRRLARLIGDLDRNRAELVATLTALGDLSQTLARQRDVIARALDALPGGLAVLDRQRPRLTRALRRITTLSDVAVPLLRESRDATVADLEHLQPILTQLDRAGREVAPSLERLASFPFNSNTLHTIKGDYSGAYINANFDLDTIIALLADLTDPTPGQPPAPPPDDGGIPLPGIPGLPAPEVPGVPGVPDLSGGRDGRSSEGLLGGLSSDFSLRSYLQSSLTGQDPQEVSP